jgi:heat shock protein HslJ
MSSTHRSFHLPFARSGSRRAVRTARPAVTGALSALAVIIFIALPAALFAAGAPTEAELRNLAYSGIYPKPVTLRDGVYEAEPATEDGASRSRVEMTSMPPLHVDLDGDGTKEAVVVLTESSGGSGVFTYLAAAGRWHGQLRNLATAKIGDRVQIRSLTGKKREVTLEFVAAGPDDPACCPTLKRRTTYHLLGGQLKEIRSEELGPLSLTDLEGVSWSLTQLGANHPVPEGVSITAQFKEGKLTGSSGCNRYFTDVGAGEGGGIRVGPVGATRMACAGPGMEAESRFLSSLEKVHRFGFLLGQLALSYEGAEGPDSLLFSSSPLPPSSSGDPAGSAATRPE